MLFFAKFTALQKTVTMNTDYIRMNNSANPSNLKD